MKGTTGSGYDTSNSFTTPGLPLGSINLSANGFKVKGKHQVDLTWSGASGDFVDIHWNGDPSVFETRNDDFHDHNIGAKGGATYTYKVCNAGTSTCSNIVTVNF